MNKVVSLIIERLAPNEEYNSPAYWIAGIEYPDRFGYPTYCEIEKQLTKAEARAFTHYYGEYGLEEGEWSGRFSSEREALKVSLKYIEENFKDCLVLKNKDENQPREVVYFPENLKESVAALNKFRKTWLKFGTFLHSDRWFDKLKEIVGTPVYDKFVEE